jgi:hypothetical protein
MRTLLGLALSLVVTAGFAFAQQGAPEIDPSSGITAVALLSGGMVVLWGYRRRK